jgi:hypothetical protein
MKIGNEGRKSCDIVIDLKCVVNTRSQHRLASWGEENSLSGSAITTACTARDRLHIYAALFQFSIT